MLMCSRLEEASCCPSCGRRYAHKDERRLVMRTLYGKMSVANPRWWRCPCSGEGGRRSSFTPLARLLPERSTPELTLIEATFAAHMSYTAAGALLGRLVPLGRVVHGNEARRHVHKIGERLDAELVDNEDCLITIPPWVSLPVPEMPLVVTIDGGYVHSSEQTSRRDDWFQAVCGTVTRHDGRVRRFGFVPNVDTHPRRRIHETLLAQGMQPNQLVTFVSDGAPDLAGWTDLMNTNADYVLDWFHIAMRFTVLANTMKGLRFDPEFVDEPDDVHGLIDGLHRDVTSAKWYLWHGNYHRAEQLSCDLSCGLYGCQHSDARTKTEKFLDELRGYLRRNRGVIPSYSERHLAGEPISSATAEATVNQVIAKRMVKKQQMRWTPTGAHHILQIRTHVLDNQLDHDINRWHPPTPDDEQAAA